MAEIIPGYTTEQKVVTVTNDDASINAELTTQAADNWIASSLFPNGTDMTILFTRTQPAT